MTAQNPEYDQALRDIIHYVYNEQISSQCVYDQARVALLDAFGCAVETLHLSPECRNLVGPVVPGTIVPVDYGARCRPYQRSFDLGPLIRYLDHNDAYPGAEWRHPSDNFGFIVAIAD